MQTFSIESLDRSVVDLLPANFSNRFCVAFSGGVDSSVLLHALASLRATHPQWRVRAMHIDHQLHPNSAQWAEHCKSVAERLNIELTTARVSVDAADAHGLEAAARRVRYSALRERLIDGEMLFTAHHADDQAETVLLALVRGAGVQGLAAMPALKPFGRGWHARPLLAFTRAALNAWAHEQGVVAIHDPANEVLRHDRNFLRHEILSKLRSRWPSVSHTVSRSAAHVSEALALLTDVARADLDACAVGRALGIESLQALSGERRRNLLRYWLRARGLPAPSTRKLMGLQRDLFRAESERVPHVRWEGAELRWHRGLLYAQAPLPLQAHSFEQSWQWREALTLPANLGTLTLVPTMEPGLAAAKLPDTLTLRFRRGGEKIRLPKRAHRHTLRNLLQECDVLPWYRERMPLIFAGKELLAVGDLAWSDDFAAAPGEVALRVAWEGAPEWRAGGSE